MAWRKDAQLEVQEPQARALAYLLNQIRPEWPVPSLLSLLEKNRDVPSLGALMVAAATKALEPTCRTPAPIWSPGPHWPQQTSAGLPPPALCPKHPPYYAHNCGGCRFEHLEPQAVPTGAASVIPEGEQ